MIKPGMKVRITESAFVEDEHKNKYGKVIAVRGDEIEVRLRSGTIVYVSEYEVERI